jgi:hypothetical protein
METTMKFSTLALATVLALSGSYAFAHTSHHHRSGMRHHGVAGMSYGMYRGPANYGGGQSGGPNNRPGLVGGDDPGTYKP